MPHGHIIGLWEPECLLVGRGEILIFLNKTQIIVKNSDNVIFWDFIFIFCLSLLK